MFKRPLYSFLLIQTFLHLPYSGNCQSLYEQLGYAPRTSYLADRQDSIVLKDIDSICQTISNSILDSSAIHWTINKDDHDSTEQWPSGIDVSCLEDSSLDGTAWFVDSQLVLVQHCEVWFFFHSDELIKLVFKCVYPRTTGTFCSTYPSIHWFYIVKDQIYASTVFKMNDTYECDCIGEPYIVNTYFTPENIAWIKSRWYNYSSNPK